MTNVLGKSMRLSHAALGTLLVCLLGGSGISAQAQNVYQCTDAAGKKTFSQIPCPTNAQSKSITPGGAPQAGTSGAPPELLAAYKRCLAALDASNEPAFFACLSRREAERRLANMRNSASYKMVDSRPDAAVITRYSGKIDASKTKGRLVAYVKRGLEVEPMQIELLFEDGMWKVDSIGDYKP